MAQTLVRNLQHIIFSTKDRVVMIKGQWGFQEALRLLLDKHGLEYDERYLWN